MSLLGFLMPHNPKKDALVSAYRREPKPQTINVNMNLNVGGALTFKLEQVPPPSSQAGVWITATGGGLTAKGKSPMSYTLPDEMMVYLQVNYIDAKGNPAKIDGETTWESSHPDIAQVVVNSDDSSRAQIWGKDIGQAQITTHADADLGEGSRDIIATLDIEVVAGEAVSATLTPSGEPEPIPKDSGVAAHARGKR